MTKTNRKEKGGNDYNVTWDANPHTMMFSLLMIGFLCRTTQEKSKTKQNKQISKFHI